MLSIKFKESIILFDNKYYGQVDGVTMGLSLSPTLATIFLCHYKTNWFKRCSKKFRLKYCRRFVDDITVFFEKHEQLQQSAEYI